MFPENLEMIKEYFSKIGSKTIDTALSIVIGIAIIFFSEKTLLKTIKKRILNDRNSNTMYTVLVSFLKYGGYFVLICHVFSLWGVSVTSLIAVAGVGSVALGFGAQSLVKDFITGLFILLEDQFGVGDFITVNGRSGTVEGIGLRTTKIRSLDGEVHIIPNSEITIVTNMSKEFSRARVEVTLHYDTDVEKALSILSDEMRQAFQKKEELNLEGLRAEPEVSGITDLLKNGVTVRILAESCVGDNWRIERELRRLIKIRLDKEGIALSGQVVAVKE